jgi:deoxyribonuclease V
MHDRKGLRVRSPAAEKETLMSIKLVVAVHFEGDSAQAVAVAFEAWDAPEPTRTFTSRIAHAEKKAARGTLDLRELPCILQLLREHALAPELIVIEGFVHLDTQETAGLGQHLFHALGGSTAVIGVSKAAMTDGTPVQFEVIREEESPPLIVTCAGIDLGAAKARLRAMHGRKRVPTLMKLAARLAKSSGGS